MATQRMRAAQLLFSSQPLRGIGVALLALFAAVVSASAADTIELIPRRLLFGDPERYNVQISPDGRQIAYVAPSNGALNVWVAPADSIATAKPVTTVSARGVRNYMWAWTSRHILFLQDDNGDENWRVCVVDLDTKKTRVLTPFDSIPGPDGRPLKGPNGKPLCPTARLQDISPNFPNEALILLNRRSPQYHDVFRVNIETGDLRMVAANDQGFSGFINDQQLEPRFASKFNNDGGVTLMRRVADNDWQFFLTINAEDALTTDVLALEGNGAALLLTDSRGRNTSALTRLQISTQETRVLAEDLRADLALAVLDPHKRTPMIAAFTYARSEWQALNPAYCEDLTALRAAANGDFKVMSLSGDGERWVVSYERDDAPNTVYLYDRATRHADRLLSTRPALEGAPLARMTPVTIKSRDGLSLVSYLTLPVGADKNNDHRPNKPLPTVLVVHGGPWWRDFWGYDAEHQWLANRGYAVLSVNYRGSVGFGKNLVNAGAREWGGKMQDDLLDAVHWAIERRIADPRRIAIMGASYGGYATLMGLGRDPTVFACGVNIVGPSSLVTLLDSIPPYAKPQIELLAARIGDHRTEEGRKFLMERSPLTYASRIVRPLLIAQGANDPRVTQCEADQLVTEMRKRRVPVTYTLFPDEGHGFGRAENRLAFYAVAEAFLAKYLGGRCEPFGDDLKGASIQAPEGSEQVPGLSKALAGK